MINEELFSDSGKYALLDNLPFKLNIVPPESDSADDSIEKLEVIEMIKTMMRVMMVMMILEKVIITVMSRNLQVVCNDSDLLIRLITLIES